MKLSVEKNGWFFATNVKSVFFNTPWNPTRPVLLNGQLKAFVVGKHGKPKHGSRALWCFARCPFRFVDFRNID
jgi:hypothetical protein